MDDSKAGFVLHDGRGPRFVERVAPAQMSNGDWFEATMVFMLGPNWKDRAVLTEIGDDEADVPTVIEGRKSDG